MELSGHYNNWRQSPAHIWFLSTFLSPRELDDNFLGVDWHRALGEPPADAVSRFRKIVLITDAPLSVRLEAQYNNIRFGWLLFILPNIRLQMHNMLPSFAQQAIRHLGIGRMVNIHVSREIILSVLYHGTMQMSFVNGRAR